MEFGNKLAEIVMDSFHKNWTESLEPKWTFGTYIFNNVFCIPNPKGSIPRVLILNALDLGP